MEVTRQSGLVTGGSAGIGRAIAGELAAAGYDVTIVARRADRLRTAAHELQAEHGVRIHQIVADLADRADVERVVDEHRAAFGGIGVLVNNAGVTGGHELGRIPDSEIDDHLEVNLRALISLTERFVPDLLASASEHGRAIVMNVASMLAVSTVPRRSVYAAVKHGMLGFTRGINADLAASGVYATALCPSYVATERTAPFADVMPPQTLVQPEDLAAAARFVLNLSPGVFVPELRLQRPGDSFGLSGQVYPPVGEAQ